MMTYDAATRRCCRRRRPGGRDGSRLASQLLMGVNGTLMMMCSTWWQIPRTICLKEEEKDVGQKQNGGQLLTRMFKKKRSYFGEMVSSNTVMPMSEIFSI